MMKRTALSPKSNDVQFLRAEMVKMGLPGHRGIAGPRGDTGPKRPKGQDAGGVVYVCWGS